MATNRYVDTSATYNGDGTTAAQATSDGGVGAYNNLADPLAAAPSGGGWDIWVRRLSTNISVTASLSPTNDGAADNPHRIIGWPFYVQHTGYTVDSAPTGTDSLGFDNNTWQFIDAALTEADNYWIAATVTFTSGNNINLSRKVIWFDATNDQIYLDFPLPNAILAGDQYTITLETEEYAARPQSGIDNGWDSDTYVRPVLDGGAGLYNLLSFYYDYYWHLKNFQLQNIADSSSYKLIYSYPARIENVLFTNAYYGLGYIRGVISSVFKDVYAWNLSHYLTDLFRGFTELEDCHFQGDTGGTTDKGLNLSAGITRLKNVTFGRVTEFSVCDIDLISSTGASLVGENVMFGSTTKFSSNVSGFYSYPTVFISGYNGEPDKFIQVMNEVGKIQNFGEDATINPPSGATTYIKFSPDSYADSYYPLILEEQRYQASGSKTYTWQFYPTGWTTLATTDIEVTAWYLDEATGSHRAETSANPSAVTNDTWNSLAITIAPAQAGTVYFELKLKNYELGAYVALDPKVDVA